MKTKMKTKDIQKQKLERKLEIAYKTHTKWELSKEDLMSFHTYYLNYRTAEELNKLLHKGKGVAIRCRGVTYTPIFYRCSYIDIQNRAQEGKMVVLSFRVPLVTYELLPTVLITTSQKREPGWIEKQESLVIEDYRTRDVEEQKKDILTDTLGKGIGTGHE